MNILKIFLIITLLMPGVLKAEKRTLTDNNIRIASNIILLADGYQTWSEAKDGWSNGVYETNSRLGPNPSPTRVINYFGFLLLGNYIANRFGNEAVRYSFNLTQIARHAPAVYNNWKIQASINIRLN